MAKEIVDALDALGYDIVFFQKDDDTSKIELWLEKKEEGWKRKN